MTLFCLISWIQQVKRNTLSFVNSICVWVMPSFSFVTFFSPSFPFPALSFFLGSLLFVCFVVMMTTGLQHCESTNVFRSHKAAQPGSAFCAISTRLRNSGDQVRSWQRSLCNDPRRQRARRWALLSVLWGKRQAEQECNRSLHVPCASSSYVSEICKDEETPHLRAPLIFLWKNCLTTVVQIQDRLRNDCVTWHNRRCSKNITCLRIRISRC